MTTEEEREVSALLSRLLEVIHRMTPEQTRILLAVDERMRREELTGRDLEELRSVEKALRGR